MSDIAISDTGTGERVLTARVAGLDVAFEADAVRAVASLGPVTPVPRAPQGIAGLAAVGDRVATVIDLARCLGGEAVGPTDLAVTVERGRDLYALAVDAMGEMRLAPRSGLRPAAEDSSSPAARVAAGSLQIDGRPVLLLDLARLLDPEILAAVGPRRPAPPSPAPQALPAAEAAVADDRSPSPAPPSLKGPLVDRLGGSAALDAAVADLTVRAAGDPQLAPLVAAADRAGLETALRGLLGALFGAPVFYVGPALDRLPELGMDGRRFDAALGHLAASLRAAGAAEADIADAVAAAEGLRKTVSAG